MIKLDQLEQKTQIKFKSFELVKKAFTHRSYLNEHRKESLESNEKLEFLGDSVLSLATSIALYRRYPKLKEGDYTDIKAAIVRTESLAQAAITLRLGDYLLLSKGEEQGNGRENINILADCFEALIAAVFIDQGFETAFKFIDQFLFTERLDYVVTNSLYLSPKTRLQELVQEQHKSLPIYNIVNEEGPEHDKIFTVSVMVVDNELARGKGSSKKQAEEEAAKIALAKYY